MFILGSDKIKKCFTFEISQFEIIFGHIFDAFILRMEFKKQNCGIACKSNNIHKCTLLHLLIDVWRRPTPEDTSKLLAFRNTALNTSLIITVCLTQYYNSLNDLVIFVFIQRPRHVKRAGWNSKHKQYKMVACVLVLFENIV